MMEFWFEAIAVLVLVFYAMKLKFDKFVAQFEGLPMDPVVPFLGHSLDYAFKSPTEVLKLGIKSVKRLGGTALLIIGFNARVFITNPKDVEEILTNRKLVVKADMYDFFADWLGNGLLVSTGQKWFTRRKIISKSFHFQILEEFMEIFESNSSLFSEQLKQFDGQVIDIFPKIGLLTLDVVCETSMGVTINAQTNSSTEYVEAVAQ